MPFWKRCAQPDSMNAQDLSLIGDPKNPEDPPFEL